MFGSAHRQQFTTSNRINLQSAEADLMNNAFSHEQGKSIKLQSILKQAKEVIGCLVSVGEKEVGEGIATPSFAAAFIFNVIFINMEERKKMFTRFYSSIQTRKEEIISITF